MNELTQTTAQKLVADKPEKIEVTIIDMEEKFARVLPDYIKPARFVRSVLDALNRPEIKRAAATPRGRLSITQSCLKAANDGLMLDGREAALIPIKIKVDNQYIDGVRYDPMVAGILKKARNSDEISKLVCQVVHENDPFDMEFVCDGPPITHKPYLKGPRGKIIGCYSIALFKDGIWSEPEWLTIEDLHRNRAKSTGYKTDPAKSPWTTDEAEMYRKSTLKRHSKRLPSSTDKDGKPGFAELLDRDNADYDTNLPGPATDAPRIMAQEQTTQDVTPPAKAASKKSSAAAVIDQEPKKKEKAEFIQPSTNMTERDLDDVYAERGYDGDGEVIEGNSTRVDQGEPEL